LNEAHQLAAAATQAWGAGDVVRAEALARQAILQAPNDPNARQVLALACLREGRASEALAHLRAADAAAPNNPAILN
jgi:Flp pilus assembly protein TadD